MTHLIDDLAVIQAISWGICAIFAIYFAYSLKKLSFGEDTGTKAWMIIAAALLLIGLRVSFKVLSPDYPASYEMQLGRYTIGIIGAVVLYAGFRKLQSTLRKMYGAAD